LEAVVVELSAEMVVRAAALVQALALLADFKAVVTDRAGPECLRRTALLTPEVVAEEVVILSLLQALAVQA
jgi:hypothetical protein